jgi:hypothetical protein
MLDLDRYKKKRLAFTHCVVAAKCIGVSGLVNSENLVRVNVLRCNTKNGHWRRVTIVPTTTFRASRTSLSHKARHL